MEMLTSFAGQSLSTDHIPLDSLPTAAKNFVVWQGSFLFL